MTKHDPIHTRAAVLRLASHDAEANTVEAIISTFSDVQRMDARGPYLERLDPAGLDTASLIGTPVLDGHRQGSGRDVIGVIEAHRTEGNALVATIRLSNAADAEPVIARILEGTLRGVSVGYRVNKWRVSTDPTTKARVRTAVAWRISETSAVPVPADPGAQFRSDQMAQSDTIETTPDAAETQRRSDIRGLVRSTGLPAETGDDLIDQDADLNAAKAAIFDAMQTRSRSAPIIRTQAPANDDPAVIVRRQSDALATRMAGGDCPEDARSYMGDSLLDMAKGSLERSGVSTRGMNADQVFERSAMHGTSDFPLVVSNAAGKVALASYQAAQSPLKTLCRQRTLTNFKESTSIRLGEMGRLEEIAESGEITHTSRAENGEKLYLKTYARQLTASRQLLLNDDLGLFGDMTAAFGEAAAQTEADILVELVTGNPDLSDGTPVFDASRDNLASVPVSLGDAGSQSALEAARKAMRTTKGMDGKTLINVTPKYLVVGPESETSAERLLAEIQAHTVDEVNPFGGKLSLLVEPRITDNRWFVFGDPARLAALQYAYLSSAQGVQIQRMEAWDTLGMKFRAFLDFGAGWLDHRGAYFNPGDA